MRNIVLLLILTYSIIVSAQHDSIKYSVIKIECLRSLLGTLNSSPIIAIDFEKTLNKHFSYNLSLEAGRYFSVWVQHFTTYDEKGIGLLGELRYYPFIKKWTNPNGFFISGHLRYYRMVGTVYVPSIYGKGYGDVLNPGINIGFKHGKKRIKYEYLFGWGLQYNHWTDLYYSPLHVKTAITQDNDYSMYWLRAGIFICYSFKNKY